MFRLSIIIPWHGGTAEFEDTLVSVLQNRPKHCEIIVPHAHDYQDPYGVGDEVRLLYFPSGDTIHLINSALAWSCGEIVHVLSCGFSVQENWCNGALTHFADPQVSCVSPLIVEHGNEDLVVAAGVTFTRGGSRRVSAAGKKLANVLSAPPTVMAPTLAAGFYRRSALVAAGGFDPAVGDQYADVDLGLTFEALSRRCVLAPECQIKGPKKAYRTASFRTGRGAERLFWRHASRRGLVGSLLAHPLAIAAGGWNRFPSPGIVSELAGRFIACFDVGGYWRYQERLGELLAAEHSAQLDEVVAVPSTSSRRAA